MGVFRTDGGTGTGIGVSRCACRQASPKGAVLVVDSTKSTSKGRVETRCPVLIVSNNRDATVVYADPWIAPLAVQPSEYLARHYSVLVHRILRYIHTVRIFRIIFLAGSSKTHKEITATYILMSCRSLYSSSTSHFFFFVARVPKTHKELRAEQVALWLLHISALLCFKAVHGRQRHAGETTGTRNTSKLQTVHPAAHHLFTVKKWPQREADNADTHEHPHQVAHQDLHGPDGRGTTRGSTQNTGVILSRSAFFCLRYGVRWTQMPFTGKIRRLL